VSEMTYKVLVACEESQTVCKAFRARGFEAYSCDIQEPSGGHPEWHILGDALKAIGGGANRNNGRQNARYWKMGFADCTPALHIS
jgi:hypothetical protein